MGRLPELIKKIYSASLDRSIWWRVAEDLASLTDVNRIWLFGHSLPDYAPTAGLIPKIPINQVVDFIAEYCLPESERESARQRPPEGVLLVSDQFYWIPLARNAVPVAWRPKEDERHALFTMALSRETRDSCDAVRKEAGGSAERYNPVQLITEISGHILASYEVSRTLVQNQIYFGVMKPKAGRQAVFLLGQNGKLVFSTAAANDLLKAKDSGLRLDGAVLKPSAIWSPVMGLSGGIGHGEMNATSGMPTALRVSRGPGTLPLFALHFALKRDYGPQDNGVPRSILVICDPEMRAPQTIALLRQTWPLTVSEARVAAQVFLGRGIDDVAVKLGVARETVRTHLKRTFAKTGTSNQAELVAFISAIQSIHFPY